MARPTTYIALLRGINVGGNRKIAMADLRQIVSDAGCGDVTTYIQSGNVVLTSSKAEGPLTTALEQAIARATGFDVPVILRTRAEMEAVVEANPFAHHQAEGPALHVLFYRDAPAAGTFDSINAARFAPEELALVGRDLYLHLPNGMGRAELPKALEKIKGAGKPTARNWNSVTKLLALASEI